MSLPEIKYCPGTLAAGFDTYSKSCLKKMFQGKSVSHILPYNSPNSNLETSKIFDRNRLIISISGVQDKLSLLLEKNRLRLANEGEQGAYILKPTPNFVKKANQMPANEHLTMQIARQAYKIETAENALIFFSDGAPAYITKRFDIEDNGTKRAQEDFGSLAQRTPQTDGEHYKYLGNYFELFKLMKQLPTYQIEAIKLYKLLIFNYLFSNGDAHLKNFSIIETTMGDFKLSPAYDLINSRIHIEDSDFALEEGLLPKNETQGNINFQFEKLAELAEIKKEISTKIMLEMVSKTDIVEKMIESSYLNDETKKNYWQLYNERLNKLTK